MSRMRTSSASFSWARAPIRRAKSSDVKRPQCSPQSGSIEATLLNQGGHGRGAELVERVAGANPGRGHRVRVDLEELDALRPGQLLEDGLEPLLREAAAGASGWGRVRSRSCGKPGRVPTPRRASSRIASGSVQSKK